MLGESERLIEHQGAEQIVLELERGASPVQPGGYSQSELIYRRSIYRR
jgi:hypothetical protein